MPSRSSIATCGTRARGPVDRAVIETARRLSGPDFADHVEMACALAQRLDLIIPRKSADFHHAPIAAIAPADIRHSLP
jgi:hypothetical protein